MGFFIAGLFLGLALGHYRIKEAEQRAYLLGAMHLGFIFETTDEADLCILYNELEAAFKEPTLDAAVALLMERAQ